MSNEKRTDFANRDSILKLLSDTEVSSVSTAEKKAKLAAGDEYLDLTQLAMGIQKAGPTSPMAGNLLPKKSVQENTWKKILTHLAESTPAPANESVKANQPTPAALPPLPKVSPPATPHGR